MAALGPLKVLLCLLVLVQWNIVPVSCRVTCRTCYRQVASNRATVTSTTMYRSTTVYGSRETCGWVWLIYRCSYQQTSSTMTVPVTRYATSYVIVYSSESYECNCVTLQPSSSTSTSTSSSKSVAPSSTTSTTTDTAITTKRTHSTTTSIGTAISLSRTDVATKDTVVETSTIEPGATKDAVVKMTSITPKPSVKSSTKSSPIATSEQPTSKVSEDVNTSNTLADSSVSQPRVGELVGLLLGILLLLALIVTTCIVTAVVLRWCICTRRKTKHDTGNVYADPNDVTLTAATYCDVDGMATIRADTVVYSTVTNGGGHEVWGGIALNPMYAEVGDKETVQNMYQYVPSKKRREVGNSEPLEPAQISSIYGTVEETYQEYKKPGHDDSPYKEPSAQLDQLYDDLAAMQCLEIPRKFLNFGPTLGSGEFGVVCKGEWVTPHGPREVALKVSHDDVPDAEKVKLLQEAAIMKQFCHPNVVRLLGTVTISDPLVLIVELLKNGSLISYLMELPKEMDDLKKNLFIKFSQQIAEGMKYLSGKGFIHRDLAARNVLLDHEYTCKISDFGLSRNLDENTYYVVKGGKIPLKWTAPEVLFYKKYSSCSDVWSYGMTLFEIWSFGEKPFSSLSPQDIIDLFDSKLGESSSEQLLPCPKDCPNNVYSIMSRCWNFDQHSRPSFAEILAALSVQ